MTESMIIEAIRSSKVGSPDAHLGVSAVPDPDAIKQFQAAMATSGPSEVMGVPFAEAISTTWTRAHENNQGILHRIRALSELSAQGTLAVPEMLELQYEVANLAFQQEVVAKVVDKSSMAVQTLIKNQ